MKRTCFIIVKHSLISLGCAVSMLMLSSCYSSTVSVGNMKSTDPAVCVATKHDAHFVNGLIGSPKEDAKDFVGENKDYRVKQYTSFTDGLLYGVTLGIYSPTTTKYYLPYGVANTAPKRVSNLPPVTFGVRLGLNVSTFSDEPKQGIDISTKTGFGIGAVVDVPITNKLFFQPGLYYTTKGVTLTYHSFGYYREEHSNGKSWGYIEVPLLFAYHKELSDFFQETDFAKDIQLQGAIGPYVAIIVSDHDSSPQGFKDRFDAGLRFELGAVYRKKYYGGIGYEFGMIDNTDYSCKTRNFFINIGYNF